MVSSRNKHFTSRWRSDRLLRLLIFCLVISLGLSSGCYTQLQHAKKSPPAAGQIADDLSTTESQETPDLPPGHPPIDNLDRWVGQSMLDEFIGADEPLRFENLRVNKQILLPAENGLFEVTIKIGESILYDCWHLTIDDFGWMVGAYWMQSGTGPQLDDGTASKRSEFRLDRDSEAALHTMVVALLPTDNPEDKLIPLPLWPDLPDKIWEYNDAGVIEFSYQLKLMGMVDKSEWPGGTIIVPAIVIQLLIGTWTDPPPPELVNMVFEEVERHPVLIDIALLIEGIILAWEVEGDQKDTINLPLRVLR